METLPAYKSALKHLDVPVYSISEANDLLKITGFKIRKPGERLTQKQRSKRYFQIRNFYKIPVIYVNLGEVPEDILELGKKFMKVMEELQPDYSKGLPR